MLRELLRFAPLPVGHLAPALSLTASDGTWIKIRDVAGNQNVALVFVGCSQKSETRSGLQEFSDLREELESLDTRVFAVSAQRPEKLRALQSELSLDFSLLYDPMAFTARAFGSASLVRARCTNATFLIDKEQNIAFSQRGVSSAQAILETCRSLEGVDAPAPEPAPPSSAEEPVRAKAPGEPQERVQDIDSKQAIEMLKEEDSIYLLVDVRTRSEYDADHSPHAIHIPVDEITHRYHELNQTDHLIFVCQAGGRSAAAGEFMTSIGSREIYSVGGGMSSWDGERLQTPLQ
ncbi:MAG: redoxin domain-containing protein [Myxococcota bacterium]|nr:redoxin domain-containing protein [Myxococcota bacterium]